MAETQAITSTQGDVVRELASIAVALDEAANIVAGSGFPRLADVFRDHVARARSVIKRATAGVLALVALAGCTGVQQHYFTMAAVPAEARVADTSGGPVPLQLGELRCNAADVRPTWHVTAGVIACWDGSGRLVISGVVPGQAVITTGMQAVGAAASVAGPVGGALILGNKMIDAAKIIDGASISATTSGTVSGNVTTSGTVNAVIPPVTGNVNLVPVVAP